MKSLFRRGVVVAGAALSIVVAAAVPSGASLVVLPRAVTATTLANLVKASASITTIPAHLNPTVSQISTDELNDTSYHANDEGCLTIGACTYGDKTGRKIAVLFGDSHAWMWLASVDPAIDRAGLKLQLIWEPGCPAAEITQTPELSPTDATCPAWRATTLAAIKAEKPALVMLAERTTGVRAPNGSLVTASAWTAGLEASIGAVKTTTTKVVVIGDDPAYPMGYSPPICLTQHPTAVQDCATPVKNTVAANADHESSEKLAASTDKVTFIDPTPWLCTKTSCSEIIGNLAVYFDWSHITATYGAYLSGVMGTKLKPVL